MADTRAGVYRPGAIVWREAVTPDLDRTTAFYTELLGWNYTDSDMGPMGVYRQWKAGDDFVGGGFQMGPDMKGVPPHWLQYISVPDVDAAAEKVKAHGGTVLMGPADIPNVGRFVTIRDPQGAHCSLFKDNKGDAVQKAPPFPQGTFCWETLATTDKEAAIAFYGAVVGYTVGDYFGNTTFKLSDDPMSAVCDVQAAPTGMPSAWMSHVVVQNLAEARDRAQRLGGTIIEPEIAIPQTGKMAVIADPVGAVISLFEAAQNPQM